MVVVSSLWILCLVMVNFTKGQGNDFQCRDIGCRLSGGTCSSIRIPDHDCQVGADCRLEGDPVRSQLTERKGPYCYCCKRISCNDRTCKLNGGQCSPTPIAGKNCTQNQRRCGPNSVNGKICYCCTDKVASSTTPTPPTSPMVPICRDVACTKNGGRCSRTLISGMDCKKNSLECFLQGAGRGCYCCKPKNEAKCNDNRLCKRLWGNQGGCVNITSMPFQDLEAQYDLNSANPTYNRYCTTSDAKSNMDCCICLRKRKQPCKDNGCLEKGGMCIDMKNSYLRENQFPRDVVDISKPIQGAGDLCSNPNGPQKKMCCQCYQRKGLSPPGLFRD